MLPKPNGLLSSSIPTTAMASVNKEVKPLLGDSSPKGAAGRGNYSRYTEKEKVKIAKRAAEMEVTNTIRHFQKDFEGRELKEKTVRTWMDKKVWQ